MGGSAMGRFMSTQEFIPCLLIPRACLVECLFPAIIWKVIYKAALNWRALVRVLVGRLEGLRPEFLWAQRSRLAPPASGPKVLKAA